MSDADAVAVRYELLNSGFAQEAAVWFYLSVLIAFVSFCLSWCFYPRRLYVSILFVCFLVLFL